MANEVSLFSAGMQDRPTHLANVKVDDMTRKLAGGGGGLRISIKGGVWRMLNDGEELHRNEDRALNVVIVASSPDEARTFYEGEYVEGESTPPTCWSSNGVAPEPEVQNKQADSCAVCPQNVAGSGNNGSRACRYSRNLAVTLENDISGKVFKLVLPAQSIFGKIENGVAPLKAYAKQLVAHNTDVSTVVTEMRFDTTSATPKVGFKAVRWLSKTEYETAKRQGQSPEALEAIKTTAFQQDTKNAAPLDLPGQSPVVEKPATVDATPPVTRQRKAKPAPAPVETKPAAVDGTGGQTVEEMQKAMAALMAQMAAVTAAQGAEPVVVEKAASKNDGPAPTGAAAMLSNWEVDEDE